MDSAVIALSVACAALAFTGAVLSATVPLLIWRCFRLDARQTEADAKIDTLDEAVSSLLELAKIGPR